MDLRGGCDDPIKLITVREGQLWRDDGDLQSNGEHGHVIEHAPKDGRRRPLERDPSGMKQETNFLESHVSDSQLLVGRSADRTRGLVAQALLICGGPKKGVSI